MIAHNDFREAITRQEQVSGFLLNTGRFVRHYRTLPGNGHDRSDTS